MRYDAELTADDLARRAVAMFAILAIVMHWTEKL